MSSYVESRRQMLEAFEPNAKAFAELIRNRHIQSYTQDHRNIKRYHREKMDFGYIADSFPIHHKEITTAEIPGGKEAFKFWFNPWCFIAFYDVRERVGADVQIDRGPVELVNKVPISGQRITGNNRTKKPQPLGKTFEAVEGKGGARDIGVKASLSIKNTLTAGGEAASFKNELEIQAAVENSVNDNRWYSTTLLDKSEWPGEVSPGHHAEVARLVSVGKYRQKVTVDGELDYNIYVLSRGDFDIFFEGRDMLDAVLSGVGNTGSPYGHMRDWARAYSLWPLPESDRRMWVDRIAGPVFARYVDYDESDNASEEGWDWDEWPIGSKPTREG